MYKSRGLRALSQLFGQASIRDRHIIKTGLRAAVVQLLAAYTVQSLHAGIQHPCVPYMTSHATHNKKSHLQAAAIIREQLTCRHAVAKVRLLFESGFYSRVAFIQDFTVFIDAFVETPTYSTLATPVPGGKSGEATFRLVIHYDWYYTMTGITMATAHTSMAMAMIVSFSNPAHVWVSAVSLP